MRHIPTTDCAKLIRRDLKAHFPGTKFSVKCHKYAGGSSIDVSWYDGARVADVQKIARRYEGASFDGMQDLKTYNRSLVVNEQGQPEEIGYGVDYIHCNRHITNRDTQEVILFNRCAQHYAGWPTDWNAPERGRFNGEWVSTLISRLISQIDYRKDTAETVSLDNLYQYV
jgi:hypothetical protein